MECVYIFDGKEYSYEQLIEKLLSEKLDNSDILYSVQSNKQDRIVYNIDQYFKENKSVTLDSINPGLDFSFGGDPSEKETNNSKHILNFLDDPLFEAAAGALHLPRMDKDSFLKERVRIFQQEDPSLSDIEALNLAKNTLQFFKFQRYDAFILHYLLRHQFGEITLASIKENFNKLRNEFSNDKDMLSRIDLIESNNDLINNILKNQKKLIIGPIEGKKGSKVFRNIPISKVLHTDRGDVKIFDQIDALVVDASGAIQIYKYKITEEDTLNWGNRNRVQTPKTEKYRFELAFLQALLEDYGIILDKNDVSLNLITLQTKYDHSSPDSLILSDVKNPRVLDMSVNNGQYQLDMHLQIARNIIQPKVRFLDFTQAVKDTNSHLERLWHGQNIKINATQQSVEDWIHQNKNKAIRKLYPDPSAKENNYYEIIYKGKSYPIKDPTEIENNQEIYLKVQELLVKSADASSIVSNSLQRAIVQAFESNNGLGLNTDLLQGFSINTSQTIKSILDPYFTWSLDKDGNRIYDWEYLKNSELADYNILLFKNRKSGQIDIINLTNLDLNSIIHFKKGSNLAGCFKSDMDTTILKSTYGNIQAIKTLIFLNYVLPNITGNFKLGNLKVITTFNNGSAKHYNIQNLVSKVYHPLMRIVEDNTPNEEKLKNNFKGAIYVDSYTTLLQDLKKYASGGSIKYIENLDSKLEKLEEANLQNDSVKIDRLLELAQDIAEQYSGKSAESLAIRYEVEKNLPTNSPLKLLIRIQEVLSYLRKQDIEEPTSLPSITRQTLKNGAVPSNNFKIVKEFWKSTSQKINDDAYNENLNINNIVFEYYKASGYTDFQGRIIGNQTKQFVNLFESEEQMRFKNPYDEKNDLKDYERVFLKKALFVFAKYRFQNNGRIFEYTDPNSDEYKEFVSKNAIWYFNCPLKKASNKQLNRIKYNFLKTKESIEKLIEDSKLWAKEFFTDEQLLLYVQDNKMVDDVTKLSVRNYFMFGETSLNGEGFNNGLRDEQLILHENKDYFEHNVENLLRDFSFESIRAQNMKKMMLGSKLFLLQMHLSGRENNNFESFKDEFDFINKYLKLNVFNLSIMDDTQRNLAKVVLPVRNFVRYTLVAGNVASALRDTIEGVGQIMARAFVKNEIDISPTNVLRAYDIVVKQSIQDSLRGRELASIVSQLCIKYRISNIDVSNVAEGMKTGNKGINNAIDSLYWTIRKPDFLNRMTLFVSKCLEDGIWDAFYLNDDGELAYDWKKDKRFSKFASGDKSNLEEYNKQKSLFFSLVHIWNKEHPNHQIENFDTLPMPYSELDIDSIKHTGDNIWGAYDKSEKALMEYGLLGQTFGMFTTWMNGQIETYFKPLQTQRDRFEYSQATDLDGNLLFLADDGNITKEDTGVPLLTQVPIQVQGIFQTLKQTLRILTKLEEGTWNDEIWGNKVNRDNINKLCTDIVMTCIVSALIKLAVDGFRDKQKENTNANNVIVNAICEVFCKGMYSAWDGFKGPLNAIDYLGNNTNPPIYTESISLAKDLIKVISGDYTLLSFGSRHFALVRPFKETIKAAQTGEQPKTYRR